MQNDIRLKNEIKYNITLKLIDHFEEISKLYKNSANTKAGNLSEYINIMVNTLSDNIIN